MKKLITILLCVLPTLALADGVLCYFKADAMSKAEQKAAATDLREAYNDTSLVDLLALPQVYLGKTNNLWRRIYVANAQAKWFQPTGKELPTKDALTTAISATLAVPTNAVFLSVIKGDNWEAEQAKAGYKDFTNDVKTAVQP
jgi:hypothetical protein